MKEMAFKVKGYTSEYQKTMQREDNVGWKLQHFWLEWKKSLQ